jgi:hypothetical protein
MVDIEMFATLCSRHRYCEQSLQTGFRIAEAADAAKEAVSLLGISVSGSIGREPEVEGPVAAQLA